VSSRSARKIWAAAAGLVLLGLRALQAVQAPPAVSQVQIAEVTRAVYEVFFQSVIALDRAADSPSVSFSQRDTYRGRLRAVAGLEESDYQFVKSIANDLAAFLEKNHREGATVGRNQVLAPLERQRELARLWAERCAAIDGAVNKLRSRLGEERFKELDVRVRQHIVPRLRVGAVPESFRESKSGGK